MWSMSRSDAAVQLAPSYGDTHLPAVALHEESTVMLVASRFSTYSRVSQVPSMVIQVGNRSRS